MSKYLLLRNNKENGPFELNDLISFGLKPYDLVWVEGKSAAWRYPSELQELKPYAPTVEEQPFDRFYKKETSEKRKEAATATVTTAAPVQKEVTAEKNQRYIPKRSVAVTLPSQKRVVVQKPVAAKAIIAEKEIKETPVITISENPAAQVKYSQPLDDIKEMYVKTLQDRKSRIARKSFLIKNLKRAAVVAGLIASGLIVGLFIKSNGDKNENLVARQQVQQAPIQADQSTEQATEQQPTNNSLPGEAFIEQIPEQMSLPQENNLAVPKNQEEVRQKQDIPTSYKKETPVNTTNNKKSLADKKIEKPIEPRSSEKDAATGERSRVVREESNSSITDSYEKPQVSEKLVKRLNTWGNLVSVNSNEYKRVALGGIRNLELTVTNDSKSVIEKVIVELQYLKSSDSPFRTEKVEFRSIAPNGGTQTLRMPDTNRGAKVSYRIIDVQAADNATASAGL